MNPRTRPAEKRRMNAQLKPPSQACGPQIGQLIAHGDALELRWRDERPGQRLTLLWLRDHCPCPDCQHPETRQRLHDTRAIPAGLAARTVALEDGGAGLPIEWAGEPHPRRSSAASPA